MPAPTITAFEVASWTATTTPRTVTVTGCQVGDYLVVMGGGDDAAGVSAATSSTTSGSTGAWTELAEDVTANCWYHMAWAQVTGAGNVDVQVAATGATFPWGFTVLQARNCGGIGNSGSSSASSIVGVLNLTTSDHSAAAFASFDFNAKTVGTFTPGSANTIEAAQGANYTIHAAYWDDQAAGTRSYGITGGGTGSGTADGAYNMVVVELLAGTGPVEGPITMPQLWPRQLVGPWPLAQAPILPSGDVAAQDPDVPLLQGDSAVYWQLYNSYSNVRSRAYQEVSQRRRDADPSQLGQPLLENELLGGATTALRTNLAASHASRRLVPQQRQYESPPGLLDTALLENELLGGATTELRTSVPATHADRREVPQYTLRESPPGLLDTALLEIPPPLCDPFAASHQRLPWLRQRSTQADQSAPPLVDFDPVLGGYKLAPAAFQRLPWLRQKPVQTDQSSLISTLVRTDLHTSSAGPVYGFLDYVTSSFTPPDNSLLVVAGMAIENANSSPSGLIADDMTIFDSVGLTWTQRVKESGDDGTVGDYTTGTCIWTAPVTTGVSMTVSLDASTADVGIWAVSIVAYTGYDTVTPIGATGKNNQGYAPATSPQTGSLTLNSAPLTSSEVFAAVGVNHTVSGVTQGTGWTEVHDSTGTAWGGLESQVRRNSTSTSVDWDSLNPTGDLYNYAAGAVEVRSGAGGVETIPWAEWRALHAVTHKRQDWLRQKQIQFDQSGLANPFDVTLDGPEWLKHVLTTHQRLPWLRIKQQQYDQSSAVAGTPFDPTQAGYGQRWLWRRDLMPPSQRVPIQNPDEVSMVGTGATLAWWGIDDTAYHFNHWLPTQSDPNLLVPPVEADPLLLVDSSRRGRLWLPRPWGGVQIRWLYDQSVPPGQFDVTQNGGYGPEWRRWYRPPVAPVQRERESDPNLLNAALLEDALLGVGYGPRWLWYRAPVAPVQRERESPTGLLLAALLEDALLLWGGDRRVRHIPISHAPRWALRLQIRYLEFMGTTIAAGIQGNAYPPPNLSTGNVYPRTDGGIIGSVG